MIASRKMPPSCQSWRQQGPEPREGLRSAYLKVLPQWRLNKSFAFPINAILTWPQPTEQLLGLWAGLWWGQVRSNRIGWGRVGMLPSWSCVLSTARRYMLGLAWPASSTNCSSTSWKWVSPATRKVLGDPTKLIPCFQTGKSFGRHLQSSSAAFWTLSTLLFFRLRVGAGANAFASYMELHHEVC